MNSKKISFKPMAAAEEGAQHRAEELMGAPKVLEDGSTKAASSKKKPGPSKSFDGAALRRLNAFMPEDLTRRINAEAVQAGQTVGEYLATKLYGVVSKEIDPKQN